MNDEIVSFPGIVKLKNVKSSNEVDSDILKALDFTLDDLRNQGIYIFGVGKLGQKIYKFLSDHDFRVLGYVDNNKALQGKIINNTQVSGLDLLDKSCLIIIASETYLNPIKRQLINLGFTKSISHLQSSILFKSFSDFPTENQFLGLTEDLIRHKEKYLTVFETLADDDSKKVFDNLLSYRMTGDITFIDKVSTPSSFEYFDKSIIKLNHNEVFIDCGGFDGDSALNFINFSEKKYASVHIFEPDKTLLYKAKNKLSNYPGIYFNELGIFNKTTKLYFESTGGSDGSIGDSGDIEISTITLDEYKYDSPPTYIKLDIEGVEIEALEGGKQLIKDQSPKLAIASYHFPRHFWEIPLFVLQINSNYRLHLRHYSDCIFGSTYYFVPK